MQSVETVVGRAPFFDEWEAIPPMPATESKECMDSIVSLDSLNEEDASSMTKCMGEFYERVDAAARASLSKECPDLAKELPPKKTVQPSVPVGGTRVVFVLEDASPASDGDSDMLVHTASHRSPPPTPTSKPWLVVSYRRVTKLIWSGGWARVADSTRPELFDKQRLERLGPSAAPATGGGEEEVLRGVQHGQRPD